MNLNQVHDAAAMMVVMKLRPQCSNDDDLLLPIFAHLRNLKTCR